MCEPLSIHSPPPPAEQQARPVQGWGSPQWGWLAAVIVAELEREIALAEERRRLAS